MYLNWLIATFFQNLCYFSGIFKHLIVEHTICSSAIVGNATTHNIDGELIDLSRTTDDQLLIDGKAKITDADIIATNGVIHLIDNIVIPESAQHINQALKTQNFTKFENLIQQAGMGDEIDSLLNSTVFAPSDEAFETPEGKKALEEIKDDPARLKEVVMYHTVKGLMQSCEMNNNAILKSNLNEMPLRLNLYSTVSHKCSVFLYCPFKLYQNIQCMTELYNCPDTLAFIWHSLVHHMI